MGEFSLKIAGQIGRVHTAFDSTESYCRSFLTDKTPDFYAEITPEDRRFEQEASWEEARAEGIRPRTYTGPHLERAAIQRKFAEHLLKTGTLMVHGSTVAVDGEAYLFTARCGTGKSTHTRLWCQLFGSRARMVNDDKPFLTVTENGVFASGSPWCGKHGLGSNITVPLKGICILERGAENHIAPISPDDARKMLLHQSYCPVDASLTSTRLELVEALLHRVPLWRMACNKDLSAAQTAWDAMSG